MGCFIVYMVADCCFYLLTYLHPRFIDEQFTVLVVWQDGKGPFEFSKLLKLLQLLATRYI
jgi:hypothetical protein